MGLPARLSAHPYLHPGRGLYGDLNRENSISLTDTLTRSNYITVTDKLITDLVATNNSPAFPGQAITFTATVTHRTNITYTWAFGDGQTVLVRS